MIKQNVANTTIKTQAILFTVACWLAAVIAFVLFADFSNPIQTIPCTIFIGLAALTVPHMVLIDGLLMIKTRLTIRFKHNVILCKKYIRNVAEKYFL